VNLYVTEEMGKGDSYVAPDPHFISVMALFASSLPWSRFEKFFESKKMVQLSGGEQLILLRLLALQEVLCLDDESLLRWAKHQLYLFSFLQPDFKPKLPTKELLSEFRRAFDNVGLLKPFRKQCYRLITEHGNRLPPLDSVSTVDATDLLSTFDKSKNDNIGDSKKKVSDIKIDLPNIESSDGSSCPNCGSLNVVHLKPSQEESSLPDIRFTRCRFCGNTFRD
jgi:DNA-directed RNA polymerase subunit M/transcription elongation factor TFIIS